MGAGMWRGPGEAERVHVEHHLVDFDMHVADVPSNLRRELHVQGDALDAEGHIGQCVTLLLLVPAFAVGHVAAWCLRVDASESDSGGSHVALRYTSLISGVYKGI